MRGLMGAAVLVAVACVGTSLAHAQGSGSATLDAARARGQVLCGMAGTVPGFSLPDSQGVMRGLDADTCRAVTAAALGDEAKTKFVPTTTQNRFTALQSGEVDLLSRSTTWTLTREGNLGLEFAWVNYYDGTGFLVKTASGVKAAKSPTSRKFRVRSCPADATLIPPMPRRWRRSGTARVPRPTTCCCCLTSSVRSRLASWSARATTNGSISCAGPSPR
ncbi:MAG: transporter substrate-binding domain-containing protein [Acetobacteraceae bacterium]